MQEGDNENRAAVYVDGFNLYHSINEFREPFLKWVCLWSLSERICNKISAKLVKVCFCTAVPDHFPEKKERHVTYNNALRSRGVSIVHGHHMFNPETNKFGEKQSDINVALSLIIDGIEDCFDIAYLISADSDQAATARFFRERLPKKRLVMIAPPGRQVPEKARPYLHAGFTLNRLDIEASVMPPFVRTARGTFIRRPREYDPPEGWKLPGEV